MPPKMVGYVKSFNEAKYISILIEDEKDSAVILKTDKKVLRL